MNKPPVPAPKKRRLFDIKTDEVSLVDRAANQRKFLVVKRNQGVLTEENGMDETIIKNLENALNKLSEDINGLVTRQEHIEKLLEAPGDIDLEKVGAKFSKATLAQLQSAYKALGSLLEGMKTEEPPVDKASDTAVTEGLAKGIKLALAPVAEGNKVELDGIVDQLTQSIKIALGSASA